MISTTPTKILILTILFMLIGCGQKREEKVILNRSGGFKAMYYSESTKNNWIPISGTMTFKTDAGEESESGNFVFNYTNYKDQFGNCTASVAGTIEVVNFTEIMPDYTEDNSASYDVNRPYNPDGSVKVPEDAQLFGANFTTTVFKDNDTYCPFAQFSTNQYAIILYPSGRLILTDINRGLDFLMMPN